MARVLIVGGGCRGLGLAEALVAEGDAVRVSTRTEAGRARIEATGAECWVGDPDRLASMRGCLDGVAVLCWLMGNASGTRSELQELMGPRLSFFFVQAIDSTVRGIVYESAGAAPADLLAQGERGARELCAKNVIPLGILDADPLDATAWQAAALRAVGAFLGRSPAA